MIVTCARFPFNLDSFPMFALSLGEIKIAAFTAACSFFCFFPFSLSLTHDAGIQTDRTGASALTDARTRNHNPTRIAKPSKWKRNRAVLQLCPSRAKRAAR